MPGPLVKGPGELSIPTAVPKLTPTSMFFFDIFIHFTPIFPQFSSSDLNMIFSALNRSAPGKVNSDIGGAWPLAVNC